MSTYIPTYTNTKTYDSETKYYCNRIDCAKKYTCKVYKQQERTDVNYYGDLLYSSLCKLKRKEK